MGKIIAQRNCKNEVRKIACQTCTKEFEVTNSYSRQQFCSVECRPPRTFVAKCMNKCETCNEMFWPTYEAQKYCSVVCKNIGFKAARKVEREYFCIGCGTKYVPRKKGNQFCTEECYHVSRILFKTCTHCGSSFSKGEGATEFSQFCSQACKDAHALEVSTDVTLNCVTCSKEFKTNKFSYEHGTRYCSTECFYNDTYEGRESKWVRWKCEGCSKQMQKPFIHRHRKFCGRSCATTGERNPMFGKLGEESAMYGKIAWNNGFTAKTDERLRVAGEKISAIICQQFVDGRRNYQNGCRTSYFESAKCNDIFFCRSPYEQRRLEMLESDPDVVWFETEPFRIPYKFEGSTKNYAPDVLVEYSDGRRVLEEIKPKNFTEQPQNLAKFAAARDHAKSVVNMTFVVLTEEELGICQRCYEIPCSCRQTQL